MQGGSRIGWLIGNRVNINGKVSGWAEVRSGVPQGPSLWTSGIGSRLGRNRL